MCAKIYIICVCLLLVYVSARQRQKLLSIEDCDLPEHSYDKDNLVSHNWTVTKVRGENIIRANFTIVKTTPPVFYSFRGYRLPERNMEFNVNRLTCRNDIVALFLKRVKVAYDEKTCVGSPGTYYVKRVSMNDFAQHYKYIVQSSNLYLLELELSSDQGVMICIAVTIDYRK